MNLKEMLGENYKEGMTLEEIESALEGLNLVDPTKLPLSVEKSLFDRTASELAEYKRKQKESMTEEQKASAKIQEQMEQMKSLQMENHRLKFIAGGYDQETAAAMVNQLSQGNMDEFIKIQTSWLKKAQENIRSEIKKDMMGKVPKINNGIEGSQSSEDQSVIYATNLAKKNAEQISQSEKTMQSYLK